MSALFIIHHRMMTNPKISIITPYKNAKPWIGRCAESLRAQDGPFEFVFIDDHSTDGSEAELIKHADDRFVLLQNIAGRGVSSARNHGLDNATGEWITFLDADDELMPNAYRMFERLLETDADIHQENHIRHYPEKGLTRKMYDNPPGIYTLENLPQAWFGVWNKLYKKELLEDIRFDIEMQYAEDEILNLECLAKARKIHHGGDVTVRHNIENTRSLSRSRTDVDLVRQIQKLCDFIIRHQDAEIRRIAYDLITVHLSARWYFDTICGENEKQK